MANGRKDVSIAQMHMLDSIKPLEYDRITPLNETLEDDTP
jgi:hypothetical protein